MHEGMPSERVSRFQVMAAMTAANTTGSEIAVGSISPLPMVVATATPKMNGAQNSATAVSAIARRGLTARDDIAVATMLEASFEPLVKSKIERDGDKYIQHNTAPLGGKLKKVIILLPYLGFFNILHDRKDP